MSTNAAGIPANGDSDMAIWSPDGARVAFTSEASNLAGKSSEPGGLFIKTIATGQVEKVTRAAGAGDLSWSPDGTRIAFSSEDASLVPGDTNDAEDVFVVSLTSKQVERVSVDAHGGQAGNSSDSYSPAWSPDGTRLLFVSDQLDPEDDDLLQSIYVKDMATGAVQNISLGRYHASSPVWSPDGARIAWDEAGIQVRYLASGRTSTAVASSDAGDPVWSPDGTRLAYQNYDRIYVLDERTGHREKISVDSQGRNTGSQSFGPIRWSPDGSEIMFGSVTEIGGELLIKNLSSGQIVRGSTGSHGKRANNGSFFGSWSPDGKRIVFTSGASNLVPCDGQGADEKIDVFLKTIR